VAIIEICKDNLLQLRLDLCKTVCSAQEPLEEIYSRQELLLPLASLLVQELLKEVQQVESQLLIKVASGRPSYDSLPQE